VGRFSSLLRPSNGVKPSFRPDFMKIKTSGGMSRRFYSNSILQA